MQMAVVFRTGAQGGARLVAMHERVLRPIEDIAHDKAAQPKTKQCGTGASERKQDKNDNTNTVKGKHTEGLEIFDGHKLGCSGVSRGKKGKLGGRG